MVNSGKVVGVGWGMVLHDAFCCFKLSIDSD